MRSVYEFSSLTFLQAERQEVSSVRSHRIHLRPLWLCVQVVVVPVCGAASVCQGYFFCVKGTTDFEQSLLSLMQY